MLETIKKRSTPSSRAASMHLTAPPRSIVRLRATPLPGPAPAAKTIASAPPTCGRTSSCSRSQSTGCAPSDSRSAAWSGLRIRPRAVCPCRASSLRRRRATCPWPPATRTSMVSEATRRAFCGLAARTEAVSDPVNVLDVDAALADLIPSEQRVQARQATGAATIEFDVGSWSEPVDSDHFRGGYGLLMFEGLML